MVSCPILIPTRECHHRSKPRIPTGETAAGPSAADPSQIFWGIVTFVRTHRDRSASLLPDGRTAVHVVKSGVVLVLRNTATVDSPEKLETPLSEGSVQLQSEAAEAFYRRIEIREITALPDENKRAAGL